MFRDKRWAVEAWRWLCYAVSTMAIDWNPVFKKYRGRWVAFADDERTVIGSGRTASAALRAAERRGIGRPTLMKMPSKLVRYVGQC